RPRVDIAITNLKAGPWPRLHFEAKRLGKGHPVGPYVGRKWLGCILTGEYARGHDDAGMLGYVQAGSCDEWAAKIRAKLLADRIGYNMVDGTDWEEEKLTSELSHV